MLEYKKENPDLFDLSNHGCKIAKIQDASIPNREELSVICAYDLEVLTQKNGKLKISDAQRKISLVLENGWMLVNRDDYFNAETLSVHAIAISSGVLVDKVLRVDLETIRKIYESSSNSCLKKQIEGAEIAEMQKIFLYLVKKAISKNASDIHIIKKQHEALVKFRCEGVMVEYAQWDSKYADNLMMSAFVMADNSDSTYMANEYQGARISKQKSSLPKGLQAIRLQYNPLENGGRYMVARLLYEQQLKEGSDINTLGYSSGHIKMIQIMRKRLSGINIVSGPTGSGKSTTLQTALFALIAEKNREINVITIEDPPEYIIDHAAQLPVVNVKTEEERKEAFARAIIGSLRSDPDVIMIGEIRDKASADLAFRASITGHQVWTSIHANDAISILARLRDQGVDLYKITDHTFVTGLIGQRLLRNLCGYCKKDIATAFEEGIIDSEYKDTLTDIAWENRHDISFVNPRGCKKCKGGYVGRSVVAEIIIPDAKFMELIQNSQKEKARKYWLESLRGVSMLEHAVQKMALGVYDPREIEAKVGMFSDFDHSRRDIIFSSC